MSKKKRNKNKSIRKEKLNSNRQKIYFDACALESKLLYEQFYSNYKFGNVFIVSHLSLGEALGNCKNEKQKNAFIGLLNNLEKDFKICVVENDNCDAIFNNITKKFLRLSLTDSLHLATAIKNKVDLFYTTDRDFDFNKNSLKDFLKNNNYNELKIKNFNK